MNSSQFAILMPQGGLTHETKILHALSQRGRIQRYSDALIRLKNKLIRQGRYADIVDEVILLLVDAKIKRVRI